MRSIHLFFVLLCVSLLSSAHSKTVFQSLLGKLQKDKTSTNNNNDADAKDDSSRRRRLSETGTSSSNQVDLDAATGTVPHMETPEEKAAKQKAQEMATCDGQMAAAMVQANERQVMAEKERDVAMKEHSAAVDKIVDLQTLLRQMEKQVAEAATTLKETKEQAKGTLEATQAKALKEQNALKEDKASALKQEKERHGEEMAALKEDKDEIIETLQKKLKMNTQELQRTLQEELEKARADRDTKLAELQAKMDAAVSELENDRDTQVTSLKQQMEAAITDSTRMLQTTKDEAKTYMVTQVNAVKAELAQVKAEQNKTNNEKNQKIKKLQDHTQKILDKNAAMEAELKEAQEELHHWRSLHATRSYCNMTHVASDLYDVSARVVSQSVDTSKTLLSRSVDTSKTLLTKSKEQAGQVYQQQVDKHWPTIEPHYEEHVKGNYKKHVAPHLEKHIFPRMSQLAKWYKEVAVPRAQQAFQDVKKARKSLIRSYGQQCKSTFKSYKQLSKENDFLRKHPLPKSVLEAWSNSCANPGESIQVFTYTILLVIGIMFHRTMFRFLWWIINIPLTILFTVTPLGLIFRRRNKPGKSIKVENDAPVPDMTPSSSDSPNNMRSPGGPYKNTRQAKSAVKTEQRK